MYHSLGSLIIIVEALTHSYILALQIAGRFETKFNKVDPPLNLSQVVILNSPFVALLVRPISRRDLHEELLHAQTCLTSEASQITL